ncbi:MAG: hypothetical protein E6G40_02825 [Actinobacteria bacterium]|nr:MAG: hypothetical protein E6G40_02825 [Actinomycetota bacterium]
MLNCSVRSPNGRKATRSHRAAASPRSARKTNGGKATGDAAGPVAPGAPSRGPAGEEGAGCRGDPEQPASVAIAKTTTTTRLKA